MQLHSAWSPRGDQPRAINELVEGFARGEKRQTLLGVTGSGKTFTVAHTIAALGLPTLVMAHNKTLAAQLFEDFRELFPNNAVEYFVSYYDYYQPEAYIPATDTYIAKDSNINDAIDRMRHAATRSLLERNDVIIVASVSCIYGLGSAEAYYDMLVFLEAGETIERDSVLKKLSEIQYERNEIDFHRGTFRVRGDVLEVFPAHEAEHALRIEWFGDTLEAIYLVDPLRGQRLGALDKVAIYPSSHYVVTASARERAIASIHAELQGRLAELRAGGKLVEAQRLEQRTLFDLEMLEQTGYCQGIENYSRHLTGRAPGEPPPTLVDYFPRQFLLVLDESHQSVPQIGAMFRGDRSRKQTLVDHGFRLPSALDNRPLRFDEFNRLTDRVLFLSATPGDYELEQTRGVVVEQVIRPTGLVDPEVAVRPATGQVDDLLEQVRERVGRGLRVLVTTLTKRMAEDLTEFLADAGVRVRYLHADIDTLERVEILRALRLGSFDVLVGINLLREGLDLPEVGLVAVLDADKEGFLRSARSLIQTIGRAARNVDGKVILYGDRVTDPMRQALDETERRRHLQLAHNERHGIVPRTVERPIGELRPPEGEAQGAAGEVTGAAGAAGGRGRDKRGGRREPPAIPDDQVAAHDIPTLVRRLQADMLQAAEALEFERAAALRDRMLALEKRHLAFG